MKIILFIFLCFSFPLYCEHSHGPAEEIEVTEESYLAPGGCTCLCKDKHGELCKTQNASCNYLYPDKECKLKDGDGCSGFRLTSQKRLYGKYDKCGKTQKTF